jgi:hypothetical protein
MSSSSTPTTTKRGKKRAAAADTSTTTDVGKVKKTPTKSTGKKSPTKSTGKKTPSPKTQVTSSASKRTKTLPYSPTSYEIPHSAMVSLGTFPREDCPKLFPQALNDIFSTLKEHKIERSGTTWATHHLVCQPKTFTVDIHVPIKTKLPTTAGKKKTQPPRVQAGSLKLNVLTKPYVGPYEKLHDAWTTFTNEVDSSNKYKPKGSLIEEYLVGPESTNDSSKFETNLMMVVE